MLHDGRLTVIGDLERSIAGDTESLSLCVMLRNRGAGGVDPWFLYLRGPESLQAAATVRA